MLLVLHRLSQVRRIIQLHLRTQNQMALPHPRVLPDALQSQGAHLPHLPPYLIPCQSGHIAYYATARCHDA